MGKSKLDTLILKRERLEAAIAQAQAIEKRKNEVLGMKEFEKVLALPDSVLRAAFLKIICRKLAAKLKNSSWNF